MNVKPQPYTGLVGLEAKFFALYFSALAAASLSEIEVCRSEWGCEPFSGAALVLDGATPMLIVLLFAPMTRRGLAAISFAIFASILWLGIDSAGSYGEVYWLGPILALWIYGTFLAITVLVISKWFYARKQIRSLPPPVIGFAETKLTMSDENHVNSVGSRKRTVVLLGIGVGLGTFLGMIEIYRATNIWPLDFGSYISDFLFDGFLAVFTVVPLSVILWNSELKTSNATILSIVVGILVFLCNTAFAHEIFAENEWTQNRARLGFAYVWLAMLFTSSVIFIYRKSSSRRTHERSTSTLP